MFEEDYEAADRVMATARLPQLRVAIATAVAAERERCAKIAERHRPGDPMAKKIAAKIRDL